MANNKRNTSRRIEPLFNDAFIRIFGRQESKNVTRSLINAIFRSVDLEEIGEIENISAERTDLGGSIDCKTSRYDVFIETENHLLDMEAQRRPDHIANRSLFYGAKILMSADMKGKRYSELPQVTIIMLLDSTVLFNDNTVSRTCDLYWEDSGDYMLATDRFRIVLVELEKVRRRYNSLNNAVLSSEALSWFYVLTNGFDKEEEMYAIAERFHTIEEFAELYGLAIGDPKTEYAYDNAAEAWREDQAWKEYYNRIEREAIERGLEKGIEQGIEQGILSLLKDGAITIDIAADKLNKSEAEIASLVKKL